MAAGSARRYRPFRYRHTNEETGVRVVNSPAAGGEYTRISSSEVLVQAKGSGSAFDALIQARVSASSSVTLRCGPAQLADGQLGEPLFRQVDPAGSGGGEGQAEAGMVRRG
jgi:hypothetical protein